MFGKKTGKRICAGFAVAGLFMQVFCPSDLCRSRVWATEVEETAADRECLIEESIFRNSSEEKKESEDAVALGSGTDDMEVSVSGDDAVSDNASAFADGEQPVDAPSVGSGTGILDALTTGESLESETQSALEDGTEFEKASPAESAKQQMVLVSGAEDRTEVWQSSGTQPGNQPLVDTSDWEEDLSGDELIEEELDRKLAEEELRSGTAQINSEEDKLIDVALPDDLSVLIDQYSVHTPDGDTQITSEVYEIVNYGNVPVRIDIETVVDGAGFELVDEKPAEGTDLRSRDASEARAVYLELQLADEGDEEDILEGRYTFDNTEYDQVMSTDSPDGFSLLLDPADEEGNPTAGGKAAFRFRGNVDPHARYDNVQLKFRMAFTLHVLDEEESGELRGAVTEGKWNLL